MITPNRKTSILVFSPELSIHLTQAPPMARQIAIAKVIGAFGPALAGLVSGAGLQIKRDGEGKIGWGELLQNPESIGLIVEALTARLSAVNVDVLAASVETLVVGNAVAHVMQEGKNHELPITSTEVLDMILPDVWAAFRLSQHAIEENLRPFSPAGGGALPTQ